ncbi:hypothetical protein J5N97_010197 [Dioscorea zingiberensis]|uniref:RING-type E3 ubiquitin transferase n=1 Tax=Dioscorea zingiberensis TaxID=325984 RepID=A0A9D5D071_9LILI|nr:hypothetical protein J5N97_010197 [Dioscorea zingiberensis]
MKGGDALGHGDDDQYQEDEQEELKSINGGSTLVQQLALCSIPRNWDVLVRWVMLSNISSVLWDWRSYLIDIDSGIWAGSMGSLLCCLRADDVEEEHANSDTLVSRQCICLRCLIQQLSHAQYIVLFQRGELHAGPASVRRLPSSASDIAAEDSSLPNTYRSPPRPLPYDDPRCSRPRERLTSRRDKCSSHSHEESEPLRRGFDQSDVETIADKEKQSGSKNEGVKLCCSNSSTDATSGSTYYFSSSEDEDVCPTCLEEYTSENPKIVMQCSHHFHLGCIYEWMERSEACPVCGKVMVFNEAR